MIRRITGVAFFLWAIMLCSQAQATHIQYVDLAADLATENVSSWDWEISNGKAITWTFDLTKDNMYLWYLDTPTTTFGPTPVPDDLDTRDMMGSYNPDYALHYVTLRINPNNYTGNSTSTYLGLKVNKKPIAGWSNPIRLYDWGVPGDQVSDDYNIVANNYKIEVTLTGLQSLQNNITIDNVNLEGCFAVPEPGTMLLFGSGLAGLAGWRRKKARPRSL